MARFSKGTTDHDGDGRMGGSRKENVMSKKKTKVEEPVREPEHQVAYLRGRKARVGGIRREDTPYLDGEADAWRDGWDYEDEAQKG